MRFARLIALAALMQALVSVGCGDETTTQGDGAGGATSPSTEQAGGSTSDMGSTSTTTSSDGGGGSSSSAPTDDPCSMATDGDHCGGELGGLADHGSVYSCAGGVTTNVVACPAGCDAGSCNAMASDPCASARFGNGTYCGGSLLGGDENKLYDCADGKTKSATTCAAGCLVEPPGTPDMCKPEGDPCQNAASGNGAYCGGSIGGDPNTLYECSGQATQSSTQCSSGCQTMPPGTPDKCASGTGTCCVTEPPGALTQAYSACGNGGSHYGRDYGTAIGTPIYSGIAGTVVGSALGYPNCYDNGCSSSCWNSFNYVKVKSDCGDPNDAGHDLFVYYLHIDSLAPGVGNGSHVEQGQLVAYSGNSGCSSGPHIHIETASVSSGTSATLNTCNSVDPASRYCQ